MMKHLMRKRSVLAPLALVLILATPVWAGEIPGKTNIWGFYPTWYFPGHRNYHGTSLYVGKVEPGDHLLMECPTCAERSVVRVNTWAEARSIRDGRWHGRCTHCGVRW